MQSNGKLFLFIVLVILLCACGTGTQTASINPVKASALDSTSKIEVYDLYSEDEGPFLQLDDQADIQEVVQTLDTNLQITPKTFCAPRYNIKFTLDDGSSVELDYFCDGQSPFIRSSLDYFKNEDYAVTDDFVQVFNQKLAQNKAPIDNATEKESYKPGSELANPASVYCEEQGGSVDMRTDETGGQYGVCIFADGSECEEWKFFRGECKPGE
jgi:putative hemolysin